MPYILAHFFQLWNVNLNICVKYNVLVLYLSIRTLIYYFRWYLMLNERKAERFVDINELDLFVFHKGESVFCNAGVWYIAYCVVAELEVAPLQWQICWLTFCLILTLMSVLTFSIINNLTYIKISKLLDMLIWYLLSYKYRSNADFKAKRVRTTANSLVWCNGWEHIGSTELDRFTYSLSFP